jgi:hypothetical protein
MPPNLELALALIRDAALARKQDTASIDAAVGQVFRSLRALPPEPDTDSEQTLEVFTTIATASALVIAGLVSGDDGEEML